MPILIDLISRCVESSDDEGQLLMSRTSIPNLIFGSQKTYSFIEKRFHTLKQVWAAHNLAALQRHKWNQPLDTKVWVVLLSLRLPLLSLLCFNVDYYACESYPSIAIAATPLLRVFFAKKHRRFLRIANFI